MPATLVSSFAFCETVGTPRPARPRGFLFVAGLVLLLVLSGCLSDADSQSRRLLCAKVAATSFGDFPSCDTLQSCVNKATETSGANLSGFSPEIQSTWRDYQVELGSSWFFGNRLKKDLRSLSSVCVSADAAAFVGQVNSVRFSLSQSVLHADAANRHAMALLALEQSFLQAQKVDVLGGFGLLSDYEVVLSNAKDAQSLQPAGFSFVSAVRTAGEQSRQWFSRHGTLVDPLTTLSWQDALAEKGVSVAGRWKNVPLWLPAVTESLAWFISDLRQNALFQSGVSALGDDWSQGFRVLEAWGSPSQPVTQRFFDLQRRLSVHHAEWLSEQSRLFRDSGEDLEIIRRVYLDLQPFFSRLSSEEWALLENASSVRGVRTTDRPFSSLPDFLKNVESTHAQLSADRSRLGAFHPSLLWGDQSIARRDLATTVRKTRASALEVQARFLDSHRMACQNRIAQLEQSLLAQSALPFSDARMHLLKSRIADYRATSKPVDELVACVRVLAIDSASFSRSDDAPVESRTEFFSCARDVRALFETPHAFLGELAVLEPAYRQLAGRPADHPPDLALGECESLRSRALDLLSTAPRVREAVRAWNSLSTLRKHAFLLEDARLLEDVSLSQSAFFSFFDSSNRLSAKGVLEFDEWSPRLDRALSAHLDRRAQSFQSFLSSRAVLEFDPGSPIEIGSKEVVDATLRFSNPLGEDWAFPVDLSWKAPRGVGVVEADGQTVVDAGSIHRLMGSMSAEGHSIQVRVRLDFDSRELVTVHGASSARADVRTVESFRIPVSAWYAPRFPRSSLLRSSLLGVWLDNQPVEDAQVARFLLAGEHTRRREERVIDPISCTFGEPVALFGSVSRLRVSFSCRNNLSLSLSDARVDAPIVVEPPARDGFRATGSDGLSLRTFFSGTRAGFRIPLLEPLEEQSGVLEFVVLDSPTAFLDARDALQTQIASELASLTGMERSRFEALGADVRALSFSGASADWEKLLALQKRHATLLQSLSQSDAVTNQNEANRVVLDRATAFFARLLEHAPWDFAVPDLADDLEGIVRETKSCAELAATKQPACHLDRFSDLERIAKKFEAPLKKRLDALSKTACAPSLFSEKTQGVWERFHARDFDGLDRALALLGAPSDSCEKTVSPQASNSAFKPPKNASALESRLARLAGEWNAVDSKAWEALGLSDFFSSARLDAWTARLARIQLRLGDSDSTDDTNESLVALERELDAFTVRLAGEAKNRFQDASARLDTWTEPPAQALSDLSAAKQSISRSQFLNGLFLSARASDALAQPPAGDAFPVLYLVPILLAIALLAGVRYYKKTVVAPKARQIERILDEW